MRTGINFKGLTSLVVSLLFSFLMGCNDQIQLKKVKVSSTSAILKEWKATLPVTFQSAQPLHSLPAASPIVTMNASGEAIIVWFQDDGGTSAVYKSEYRSGSWIHPTGPQDNITHDWLNVTDVKVAMSDNGEAVIVLRTNDQKIYFSEYRFGSWNHPDDPSDYISPDGGAAWDPKVSINSTGETLIIWHQEDGIRFQVYKSEYRSGTWTHPTNLADNISQDGQAALYAQSGISDNGDALIVWQQSDGTNSQIFKSEYRAGTWTHPANLTDNISPDGKNAQNAEVSMNATGEAIIVWRQYNGVNQTQIFKSEYFGGSWTHPANVEDNISPDGKNTAYPQVVLNNSSDAVIVWQQFDAANDLQTFKSEYRGGVWTHPAGTADNISPDGEHVQYPKVDMNNSGETIIVWHQSDGTQNQIFKSEYRGGVWTHPANLTDNISPDSTGAYSPRVAISDNSDALIVWGQYDGQSAVLIMKSEYRSGSWVHPASINDNISLDGQSSWEPKVAINDSGDAIVVWAQSDGSFDQIFKSEYRSGVWTHPADLNDNISPDGDHAYYAEVAMNDVGDTVVVWEQSDGGSNDQVFKSEYRAGVWTHPANLTDNISPDTEWAVYPKVAMNDNGDTVIVWEQLDVGGQYAVFKSEYRSGVWTHPANLADNISDDSDSAFEPQVAIGASGETLIVWYEYDGVSDTQIYKSEYRSGVWTHPANLLDYISSGDSNVPQVAISENGDAVIVWEQYDGATYQIVKAEYRSGVWTYPAPTDTISPAGTQAYSPMVRMNDNGDTLIVWGQTDGTNKKILKSEYRSGSWTHPANLSDFVFQSPYHASGEFQAAISDNYAVIAWIYEGSLIGGTEYVSGQWSNVSFNDNERGQEFSLACNSGGDCLMATKTSDGNPVNTGVFAKLRY